uniref:Cytochrome c oxidase subunit 3 n=1 Tax=Ibalia sp. ZJUH 20220011 TaxID=2943457 RepID=A0A9E8G7U3_9HYME|nr:cytochrome c oxidase subunit 3 [Ibalia sp. ZJUH 20220011]
MYFYNHPYHLVSMSPWPMLTSLSFLMLLMGSIKMFYCNNYLLMFMGILNLILISIQWWRDTIRESTFQGMHTFFVMNNLKLGMMLFIISELFFFISFFWAFCHASLSSNIEIGSNWPPKNISSFNPYQIPLLNTIILLSSGISITYCHYSILNNKKYKSLISLTLTIILGLIFTFIQLIEYMESLFTMNDSIFGSLFFMTTGFHGLHVIIGTLFLIITLIRLMNNHLSFFHHFCFEASSWYWHFVDVIWIIVFSLIYWWSY